MSDRRQQIKDRVKNYNSQVNAIRGDRSLSALGKRKALAALHEETAASVGLLRMALDEEETANRRSLERRLFGVPAGADSIAVRSYREAMDTVEKIKDPLALGERMEEWATLGDDLLVRAAARYAWRQSANPLASDHWSLLVGEYCRQNPDHVSDIDALNEATRPWGPTRAMTEQMEMSVREPAELRVPEERLSDERPQQHQVEYLGR